MSSEFAIRVLGASKHYQMYNAPADRFKQMIVPKVQAAFGVPQKCFYKDFSAVHPLTFDVPRGQTVGIIGRNGSGKSTLLQMICGTLGPSSGRIEVNGRVAALLELGAGFNPEFSGRENVKLNCAILGLTPTETRDRFDAIEQFADIGMFIDQPVKTYSSGMYVRLAFAVAINVDPDILVVDEALAVGDEGFQRKCYARIEQIRERGATILFVSHGAQTIVQLCDRAILMDRGEILMDGNPREVVRQYQRLVNAPEESAAAIRATIQDGSDTDREITPLVLETPSLPVQEDNVAGGEYYDQNLIVTDAVHYSTDGAEISNLRMETEEGKLVNVVRTSGRYRICYEVAFNEDAHQVAFGFQIKSVSGLILAGSNTSTPHESRLQYAPRGSSVKVCIEFKCNFQPATYFIDVGVHSFDSEARFMHRLIDAFMFKVESDDPTTVIGQTYVQSHFLISLDASEIQHEPPTKRLKQV